MDTFAQPHTPRGTHRRSRSPLRIRGDLTFGVASVGLGLIVGSSVVTTRSMWDAPGGLATSLGTVSAMAGTYLCLVLLLLISRVPWLEREVGHDRMVLWHRTVAPWSLLLILGHVFLTALGFGQTSGVNVFAELWSIILTYPWMVPAACGFALMMLLGVMSYRRIRERMKYETWWTAHLYFYVAVVLAFGHQLETGTVLTQHVWFRWIWIAMYVFVFGTILVSRVISPLVTSRRHQLRVSHVVNEATGMVSVYITGRDLGSLTARGGQFFQWRFMTRHWWWQAHPYSLSAGPTGQWLRITVKNLGDQSGELAAILRPGTRVIAEGPYGVFTADRRRSDSVVAFAAGVGITPIRAMLDDMPVSADVTLLYRVTDLDSVPLRHELEELAIRSGWKLWYLPGTRNDHPMTVNYLSQFAPNLSTSDVFVCGPTSFTDSVLATARAAGVPESSLHHESFAF